MSVNVLTRWKNHRLFRRAARWLPAIYRAQEEFSALPDERLTAASRSLALQVRSGEPLPSLVPRAFGLVREAARRTFGMEHFDVQLLGGAALVEGWVAEMMTGEGKTLTATLPMYLRAAFGHGAHLVTANDYLAGRDAAWVRPLFALLGLSVGVIVQESSPAERQAAYACDITYGTLKEFAFDFLRDRLARSEETGPLGDGPVGGLFSGADKTSAGRFDRPWFLLVDEADSQLIDEARTPLIISAPVENHPALSAECFQWAANVHPQFERGRDFNSVPNSKDIRLTDAGRDLVRMLLPHGRLAEVTPRDAEQAVCRAIRAERSFHRDEHYIVAEEEILLVDQLTGRTTPGRQLRDGLHQALQAREGVPVTPPLEPAARITVSQFVSRYRHVAGMTGTARESTDEFRRIYHLPIAPIPTNRPCRRMVFDTRIFATLAEKHAFLVEEVEEMTSRGRPVLIGTRTIRHSRELSDHLNACGVEHALLNGVQDADEAEIVARAGQSACVTVATNMAGRGTDIPLAEDVIASGGLHVVGTEFHESPRIDRQLAGRSARQGDPGSFRQLASFEDSLPVEAWGEGTASELRAAAAGEFSVPYAVSIFRKAQRDVVRRHRRERSLLIESERRRRERNTAMGRDPWLDDLS